MNFYLLIGFVFVVSLTHAEDTDVEQPEIRSLIGSLIASCTQSAQLDLQLIVDTSQSVGELNFHSMMKDIAEKVLASFVIGPKNTRVALFKYSHKMFNEFDLDKFPDIESLKTATEAVKYVAGATVTGKAMKEALGHFTKKMRKDAKTAKVCIVFTDGESSDASDIPGVTKEWVKAGVTMFAVGIGPQISKTGLDAIAGNEKNALQVKDFSELAKFAKTLLVKVCTIIATLKPTDCMTDNGKTYKGSRSYTASGVACKKWEDALGNQWYWKSQKKWTLLPSNYCRNPNNEAIARGYNWRAAPWCYKEDGKKGEAGGWDYCSTAGKVTSIPKCGDGCIKGDGRTYQGTKSVTDTGVKCKKWVDALGAQWYWKSQKKWLLLPEDYCRNPYLPAIAHGYGYRPAPWCYKEGGGWAYCSFPKC